MAEHDKSPKPSDSKLPGAKPPAGGSRPGVMGDGTEEQNLGQPGNPGDRITEDEVKEAFGSDAAKSKPPRT